jgi:hypothetical protein
MSFSLHNFEDKNLDDRMSGDLSCVETSFNKPLSNGLMAILMLSIMYSFGTFGLLNLFGIRQLVQLALITLVLCLFVIVRPRYKSNIFYPVLLFMGLYAAGGVIYGGQLTSLIESVLLMFIVYVIYTARPAQIFFVAKAFVISTCFFCILVLIGYCFYKIYPSLLYSANIYIYDSTVGGSRIFPGNIIDWISFTSGDGFVFGGEINTRMKGYSNEPSSTIVHYLAPAILAFALGGVYKYFGFFIVVVNFVAIGSFTAYIIVFLSFVIFFLAIFLRRNLPISFAITSLLMMVVIINPGVMYKIFEYFSEITIYYLDFDLISRKMGGDNLEGRNSGMIDGLVLIFISPFGYSSELLGSGAGMFYIISSFTGWVGCFVFSIFIFKLVKLGGFVFIGQGYSALGFSICLFFSLLFIVLFVSGYGWSRPPGVIMLMLIYRLMDVLSFQCSMQEKSIVQARDGISLS